MGAWWPLQRPHRIPATGGAQYLDGHQAQEAARFGQQEGELVCMHNQHLHSKDRDRVRLQKKADRKAGGEAAPHSAPGASLISAGQTCNGAAVKIMQLLNV